ncbi:hypothetical protein TWF506_004757 [Arthrobotrys conoides]|uniref:Uncharacterized protein n=1 Tax=Arthrobotrys conoides TaxID=74498 RepID=A0AAN8RP38_9PEZI
MVWDYNDRTPPLQPKAARLRFIPPLMLGLRKIPHVIWGDDALICHEAPVVVWTSMEILVPTAYLEEAANCLTKSLPTFSRAAFPSSKNDELLPCYSDDCILLAADKSLSATANYIILIPDTLFHFDTTDKTLIQEPPSYFKLSSEFSQVGVPSFAGLMSALLSCVDKSKTQGFSGFQEGRWRMNRLIEKIVCRVIMLVAWKRREPWEKYYDDPEEYPPKLKEIRNCLPVENIPVFDSIYTKHHG